MEDRLAGEVRFEATDGLIRAFARRYGRKCRINMTEDFYQEAQLAVADGKDPLNAIRYAYRYWEFGYSGHRHVPYDRPVHVEVKLDKEEEEGGTAFVDILDEGFESKVISRDYLQQIYERCGYRSQQTMRANYFGEPCVWRPEVKAELLAVVSQLKG